LPPGGCCSRRNANGVSSKGRAPPVRRGLHACSRSARSCGAGRSGVGEGVRLVVTPAFVALAVIETTDVVFALDSIPAVLAVTRDPFVVYTSNLLALVGLRSLYFVVSDLLGRLRYLRQGLAVVLVLTGAKMFGGDWIAIGPGVSVGVIALVLGVTIFASLSRGAVIRALSRW